MVGGEEMSFMLVFTSCFGTTTTTTGTETITRRRRRSTRVVPMTEVLMTVNFRGGTGWGETVRGAERLNGSGFGCGLLEKVDLVLRRTSFSPRSSSSVHVPFNIFLLPHTTRLHLLS